MEKKEGQKSRGTIPLSSLLQSPPENTRYKIEINM
jgi:hypothetical protein